MTVTINGSTGVTTPDVTSDSYTGPISVSASAPSNSVQLNSSGNLGLGVTPSAWGGGYKALQLPSSTYGGGSFLSDNGSPAIAANAYNNSGWKYVNNDYATIYQSRSGQHQWYTAPSGTAGNAISFTQAMTLTAGGDLLLGDTSSSSLGGVFGVQVGSASKTYAGVGFKTSGRNYLIFTGADGTYNNGLIFYDNTAAAERARIDSSGNLLVGTTATNPVNSRTNGVSLSNNGFKFRLPSGNQDWGISTTSGVIAYLYSDNGSATVYAGSIAVNGNTASYNSVSDYRLKENIQPMTGALAKVAALKPCTYKWKADGSDGEGFIAHELAEVCPHAVTGEKDATRVEQYEVTPAVLDDNGQVVTPAVMGERTVPVYQGIDTSFLVATLTAAIQEQQAIIDSLTTRIAALEAK